MPYIPRDRRRDLVPSSYKLAQTPGELNYQITEMINYYLEECRLHGPGLNYQVINDVLGALVGATLEFYRRVVVPYEDTKKEENGDVY